MNKIGLIVLCLIFSLTISCDNNSTNESKKEVEDKVVWKMASSFPGTLNIIGEGALNFIERIDQVSNGSIKIKFFEPGALVPALEVFDPVSTGAIDAAWSTPGFWAGKIPAAQFFTAIPFGPSPGELLGWYHYGGGKELWEEIYHRHNVHPVQCLMISPEASGWFKKEINSIEDLKGLKMRFFGLGAVVMGKLGVSTQLLAPGDIYPALELGTIDATEFSMPIIDKDFGFHQIAKHYYFPGWHQPFSTNELMINLDRWNALSTSQKAQIETTCTENVVKSLAMSETRQPEALEFYESVGVTLHRWPDEILEQYKKAWDQVVKEKSSEDEDFARVWNSLSAYREKYKIWKNLGYVD